MNNRFHAVVELNLRMDLSFMAEHKADAQNLLQRIARHVQVELPEEYGSPDRLEVNVVSAALSQAPIKKMGPEEFVRSVR